MNITVSVRHCEIPDELRERAEQMANRLDGIWPRLQGATIVFGMEGLLATAEVRMQVRRGESLVATGEASDHRTALDRAEDKLRKQLEKASGKPRTSRQSKAQSQV